MRPEDAFVTPEGLHVAFRVVETGFLRAHEEVEKADVDSLSARIERDGAVLQPVVADADTGTILDGHHRVAALRLLGCRRIPAYLVPYAHESIVVTAWGDGEAPTKHDVLERARTGRLFAPKTTRHERLRRLPGRPTPLRELRG